MLKARIEAAAKPKESKLPGDTPGTTTDAGANLDAVPEAAPEVTAGKAV